MQKLKQSISLETINDDVFCEICDAILLTTFDYTNEQAIRKTITGHQSLKSLSSTNWSMRRRLEPIVFKSIFISAWTANVAVPKFQSLENSQAAKRIATRLSLKIYKPAPEGLETDELPRSFVRFLSTAQKIQKIDIDVPDCDVEGYQLAIQGMVADLPTIRTLRIKSQMGWMIARCPNLTTISSIREPVRGSKPAPSSYDSIKHAKPARNLQHLEIDEHWDADILSSVSKALPGLRSFAMVGSNQYFKLQDLLPALSQFEALETLAVPPAHDLGVGFDPPRCGNAYMGPRGKEVARRVEKQEREAEELASRMIFAVCKQLEVLWIGNNRRCTPVWGEDGSYKRSVIVKTARPRV